jgi:hypothetical protein
MTQAVTLANAGVQGSAKAWVNFNGTGTVAIRGSYNVSSITDNGTGDYTINFTNALPDANYAAIATAKRPGSGAEAPIMFTEVFTTSSVRINNVQPGVSFYDSSIVNVSVFD